MRAGRWGRPAGRRTSCSWASRPTWGGCSDPAPAVTVPRELARVLTLRDLVLIVVGTTLGSGIFAVPGAVLRQSGSDVGVALVVWVVGSVLALLGALTFGELGAMLPDAGGSYVYVREAFGSLPAFLLGWALFLAINTGSTATLAVAFANYLGELVPLPPAAHDFAAVAMIAAVAAVNIRGVRHAASVQNWSTGLKVAAILALAAAGFALGDGFHGTGTRAFITPLSLALLSAAGVALLGVLWAYEGWQNVTNSAGEARDPQRTFARGIGLGTAALVAIYLTANAGYVAAVGASGVAASDRIAADVVHALFGPAAAKPVTLVILVSIFSAANGLALTGPRMYFAMARDGVFFRALAQVHPRFGTPALAVLVSATWAALLAASGTFEQLFTYVVFASWLFAALAAASVFVLRRRRPDAPRPFRVPGYPLTPALFIAPAVALVLTTLVAPPQQARAGLGNG